MDELIMRKSTEQTTPEAPAMTAAPMTQAKPAVDAEFLKKLDEILEKYKAGRQRTDARIKESEDWWRLRNAEMERKTTESGKDGGFQSVSGWLHNVIVSKHADAMDAFPEPVILPREAGDKAEAHMLTSIIPCILEQNDFEDAYSKVQWKKICTGTGAYKTVWDNSKLNGLGDISITRVNLLNLFWEPAVEDIQDSHYMFEVSYYDKDELKAMFPQLENAKLGIDFQSTKLNGDEKDNRSEQATVKECYYHKVINGKRTLQYVKYVNNVVLYATENDTQRPTSTEIDPMTGMMTTVETGESMAERGLYDHGLYPYDFDVLFPVAGSPCGYGFVDLCRNPQTRIDVMQTAFTKNAVVGAIPRYFSNAAENGVNEEEFLDMSNPIIHFEGSLDDRNFRHVDHTPLDGAYITEVQNAINEMRETSGNTQTAAGTANSGVTAASAIAALQEASGKGSRDSTATAYRAYSNVVRKTIELVRQFYDLPRQFRILGQYGTEQFVSYTNEGLKPQIMDGGFGLEQAMRLPVFDIKINAQKRQIYSKVAQNELSLQFYQMGFFAPQNVDQALLTMDMMEFDGKEELMAKLATQGGLFQKLVQYMQLALEFAAQVRPDMVDGISQDIMQTVGTMQQSGLPGANNQMFTGVQNMGGLMGREPSRVQNARANANEVAKPNGGKLTAKSGG